MKMKKKMKIIKSTIILMKVIILQKKRKIKLISKMIKIKKNKPIIVIITITLNKMTLLEMRKYHKKIK